MYSVVIAPTAKRQLKAIARQTYKIAIIETIDEIKADPLLGKPLQRELARKYSYRAGKFRIIYIINQQNKTVSSLTASHRSSIYNK